MQWLHKSLMAKACLLQHRGKAKDGLWESVRRQMGEGMKTSSSGQCPFHRHPSLRVQIRANQNFNGLEGSKPSHGKMNVHTCALVATLDLSSTLHGNNWWTYDGLWAPDLGGVLNRHITEHSHSFAWKHCGRASACIHSVFILQQICQSAAVQASMPPWQGCSQYSKEQLRNRKMSAFKPFIHQLTVSWTGNESATRYTSKCKNHARFLFSCVL